MRVDYGEHVGGAQSASTFDPTGPNDGSVGVTVQTYFGYETRPDTQLLYRTGFRREITRRLQSATVYVSGTGFGSPGRLQRHVVLHYDTSPASGRSRITQIEDRGTDDGATASPMLHDFTYSGALFGGFAPLDGRWALPSPLTFTTGGRDTGVRLVDVNVDGWLDVLRGNNGQRGAWLGGPTGFSTSAPTFSPPADFVDANGYTGLVFSDFDADGRQDLIRRRITDTGDGLNSDVSMANTACAATSYSWGHEDGPAAMQLERAAWTNFESGFASAPSHNLPAAVRVSAEIDHGYDSGPPPASGSCPVEQFPLALKYSTVPGSTDLGTRIST